MYGYSLYLYFDFAGYSAFAVGVSYLLGIRTPENFNRPFLAGNIKDFWNRWHISLSTWIRDHIYMRFLLAATKGRWFAGKYTASYLGFFLAFGLMGLWHGIEPYYLLYGLYHGTLLVGHDLFTRWNKTAAGVGRRAAVAGDGDPGHVPPGLPGLPPLLREDRSHVEAGPLRTRRPTRCSAQADRVPCAGDHVARLHWRWNGGRPSGGILPMTISDRVLNVLVGVSEIEDVRHEPDVRLYDLQILDSMKTVELIVEFSSEFGVEISPAEFDREEWATPRKIISYMERKLVA